jgi:hypothetical protein
MALIGVPANGVVLGELLSTEDEELTDLEKYTPDLELEGDGHGVASPIAVAKLALVGTETRESARMEFSGTTTG